MAQLPQSARAVVIGGGIIGASVLYHLVKKGWHDVVLVEKNELTSGTTWHSAALVSPMRGTRSETAMARYSGDLYERLREETGVETGMRRSGHLNIAASEARFEELRHGLTQIHAFGLEAEMVDAAEVKRRWPLMETSDLLGAIWTPSSGRADPSNIVQALIKGARAGGAQVFEHTAVTGIERKNGRVTAVQTGKGRIATEIMINCAGLWGREVASLAGQPAPIYACEHFYLLTEPIQGVTTDLPVFRDGDKHLYVREEVGGLLVGCFEPNPKALPLSRLPKDAAYILMDEDWDHFAPMIEGAMERLPCLETAGARMLLNGPESFTSDNAPLMGESGTLKGFWYCCGMNSAGVVLGGGSGWALADWIVDGEPPLDLTGCDVTRFPLALDTEEALSSRIPEVLSHHFSLRLPGRENETARGLRRSALHREWQDYGSCFGARTGWEKPLYFDAEGVIDPTSLKFGRPAWQDVVDAEVDTVRNGVGVFDQSSFGKLRVQGRDAEPFLQRLCAADISGMGRAHYTALLNEMGGFVSDLTVTKLGEADFLLITGTGQLQLDLAYLQKSVAVEQHVSVTDVTSGMATLLVTGPGARTALSRLTPADLSNEAFPFGAAQHIEAASVRVLAARVSFAGDLGWELHVPTEMVCGVWEALSKASPEIRPCGANALNVLRLERGFRSWGHDMGPRDTVLETGLGFGVALSKSDFIGRDAVLRQKEAGLARRLANAVMPMEAWPFTHHPIYTGNKLIGELSSAALSVTLQKAIGLAWVEHGPVGAKDLEAGSFEVEVGGRRYPVDLSCKAPFDPKGERMRS